MPLLLGAARFSGLRAPKSEKAPPTEPGSQKTYHRTTDTRLLRGTGHVATTILRFPRARVALVP
jgi:hypothetical protein